VCVVLGCKWTGKLENIANIPKGSINFHVKVLLSHYWQHYL
jgi:hypothetical protein